MSDSKPSRSERFSDRHWLMFGPKTPRDIAGDISGKRVTGCGCGFVADVENDNGYGDSVVDHLAAAAMHFTDPYELRERGFRVLGHDQCCELACDWGACESCPCCCAGWCVSGHSGEIPQRDLSPASDYRIWLNVAKDHNPVAKLLAELEGAADVNSDGLDRAAPITRLPRKDQR